MPCANLRYNLVMEFGRISHALARSARGLLHLVADSLVTSAESPSSLERPLSDGAEFSGDLNFRTGKMDCGTDPSGWYEDDL